MQKNFNNDIIFYFFERQLKNTSRIIVGTDLQDERLVKAAQTFAALLQEGAIKKIFLPYLWG